MFVLPGNDWLACGYSWWYHGWPSFCLCAGGCRVCGARRSAPSVYNPSGGGPLVVHMHPLPGGVGLRTTYMLQHRSATLPLYMQVIRWQVVNSTLISCFYFYHTLIIGYSETSSLFKKKNQLLPCFWPEPKWYTSQKTFLFLFLWKGGYLAKHTFLLACLS